ncbi:hypothetical protein [Jeotgalibacillus sp. R-1-5s-1]|uniref:hypothetical protein n=1 Tax=Jeotgalibacillus sp. R-1-5s-1 TaxID=2555897 RepID=UPI001069E8FD|nr:hypothetical protein [Jeotgalibacillus sp. R-1-5s-1]TFD98393.1 hypothetical protein E2491_08115 [Jeotgalibacillus sp. R-1-5s-1]
MINRADLSVDIAFMELHDRAQLHTSYHPEFIFDFLHSYWGNKTKAIERKPFGYPGEPLSSRLTKLYYRGFNHDGREFDLEVRFMNTLEDIFMVPLLLKDLHIQRVNGENYDTPLLLINVHFQRQFSIGNDEGYFIKRKYRANTPGLKLSRDLHIISINLPCFKLYYKNNNIDFEERSSKWLLMMSAVNPSGKIKSSTYNDLVACSRESAELAKLLYEWEKMNDDKEFFIEYEYRLGELRRTASQLSEEWKEVKNDGLYEEMNWV